MLNDNNNNNCVYDREKDQDVKAINNESTKEEISIYSYQKPW